MAKETGFFRGAGGVIWRMDLPLPALMGEQLAKQELVRVEAEWVEGEGGEPGHYQETGPYAGPSTPVVGGLELPVDPKDVEIQRLRAKLAELEAGGEPAPEGEGGGKADVKRPAVSAAKPEWVAYAVSRGMPAEEAESATKAELVELFGSDEK